MAKAALHTLAAAWIALTLAFVALRTLPGDAVSAQMAEAGLGAAAIADRQAALGLDQPILTQYVSYIAALLRGDLGFSLYTGEPVGDVIAARAPSTIALAAHGIVVMAACTAVLGLGAARTGALGRGARGLLLLGVGVPSYVTGTLLILVVGLAEPDSALGVWMAASIIGFHAAGPAAAALSESVHITRAQQYVVAAHARGLVPLAIEIRHVLSNAILPILPLLAAQIGFLLSGTVITEIVFARPGLGRLMLDAVLRRDLPVVQALILLIAVIYAGSLLASDAVARLIDPRPRV